MAKKQTDERIVAKMRKTGRTRQQHKNKYGQHKAGRKN